MLRIQREQANGASDAPLRIRLTGQLRGLWVDELRRYCASLPAFAVEIDMADVSFVDADGVRLLRALTADRVALVNCALFVAEQLRTLEQDV